MKSGEFIEETPTVSLKNVQLKNLLKLDAEEMKSTIERCKVFLGKTLCNNFEYFHFLTDIIPAHTSCRYQQEMASQSVIVPLPLLKKDEKKYLDIVNVFDQLEGWVHDICSKAAICDIPTNQDNTPPNLPVNARSRPDQLSAHIPPTSDPNDPVRNLKIPCFGDQLTRVRLAGAKDLRSGSHTPRDRFEHIHPVRIVDWDTQRSFLKV